MNSIIYRKTDLQPCGTAAPGTAIEDEIQLNVVPNFGGEVADYDFIKTDEVFFHLENQNGEVVAVKNDPPIVQDEVDEEKVWMAEAIIDLSNQVEELKAKIAILEGGTV